MKKLTPADQFALEAVSGWLMLGNPVEARAELQRIPNDRILHPSVFLAIWELHAFLRQWEDALFAADFVLATAPDWPDGYIKRAYALHEMKRTAEAWKCLLPASRKFGSEWVIPYNLACYACRLGRPKTAAKWLERALKKGDLAELKEMALIDPDLEPLRPRIAQIARQSKQRGRKTKIL